MVAGRLAGAMALLGGAYLVLRPFLVPMVWAAIVAYVTWPLHARVRDRIGRPHLVAALFTAIAVVLVALPVGWFIVALAEQGTQLGRVALDWLEAGAPLPDWLARYAWVQEQIARLRGLALPADLTPYLARFGAQISNGLVRLASGLGRNIFSLGVMLIGLYTLYVHGARLASHTRHLVAAFLPATSPQFLEEVGAVVRAVVFGLIGTAIAQGILAGFGFSLFGVPFAVALGALTSILSFVPAGPVLVWGGAALWLLASDQQGAALGMALWGILVVSSVDNVLRPILISRSGSIRIPFLVVFFGVFGGLAAFGPLGLFLGPVLLSVVFALAAEFPQREASAPVVLADASASGSAPEAAAQRPGKSAASSAP
jgi:predicted PurR-regulated permease PerM